MKKYLKITQLKGLAGRTKRHRATVAGLGLRRRHHTVKVEDTPANRGMVQQVAYLLQIEEEIE